MSLAVRAMTASFRALFGRDDVQGHDAPSLAALRSGLSPPARALFARVVDGMAAHAPRTLAGELTGVSFAQALARLCNACDGQALRTPESFVAATGASAADVFSELARHLVCAHPVPRFMDNAFAEPEGSPSHALFLHLGRGGSWRTAAVPWTITRRAAHVLSTWADRSTPVTTAIRIAQLRSVRAPAHVVDGVLQSMLVHRVNQREEAVWLEVFAWLARQPEQPPASVALVIADIAVRLQGNERFSVKGRTLGATLRVVERRVRDEERFAPARAAGAFPVCAIEGGDVVVTLAGTAQLFRVRQLATGAALAEESQRMRNCVVNYVEELRAGEKLLFSLTRVLADGTETRALTFELAPGSHEIIEARGVLNRDPTELERAALVQFAKMRSLALEI